MRPTPEQHGAMAAYKAAAQALADDLRSRVGERAWAEASRLIDANEAPIALNHLAHAIERLRGDAVTRPERQRLFDLVYGSDEVADLPLSFSRMKPRPDSWWLEGVTPGE